jgi:hypothetical protein
LLIEKSPNDALRTRLQLVAAERNIPGSDMKWLGRLRHQDLAEFVWKHRLSSDWVLCGDLKGRLRMARAIIMKRRRRSIRKHTGNIGTHHR